MYCMNHTDRCNLPIMFLFYPALSYDRIQMQDTWGGGLCITSTSLLRDEMGHNYKSDDPLFPTKFRGSGPDLYLN
jgi:hypothetical protein